jgi:hypothetical protein
LVTSVSTTSIHPASAPDFRLRVINLRCALDAGPDGADCLGQGVGAHGALPTSECEKGVVYTSACAPTSRFTDKSIPAVRVCAIECMRLRAPEEMCVRATDSPYGRGARVPQQPDVTAKWARRTRGATEMKAKCKCGWARASAQL